jgi:hypothetical protein
LKKVWSALRNNSLFIMSIGLMAASSGIDGAYMAAWMPPGAGWLGYVLNTVSDVASEILMYWFGRLQQERKRSKKWKLSWWLLPAVGVIVAFSWFFSWRQLLRAMRPLEGEATRWVAPVSAAFVPALLAATGYAQALLAGKFEDAPRQGADSARSKTRPADDGRGKTWTCPKCGASAGADGRPFRSQQSLAAHIGHCDGKGGGDAT